MDRCSSVRARNLNLPAALLLAAAVTGCMLAGCGGDGGESGRSGEESGQVSAEQRPAGGVPESLPAMSSEELLAVGGRLQGAYAAVQQNNPDQAIEYLRLALDEVPDGAMLHYHLAVAYGVKGEPDSAMAHLKRGADLGLSDVRMIERDQNLAEVRRLPEWPEVRRQILETGRRFRKVDLVSYERLDPETQPDFPSLDSLQAYYQAPLRDMTIMMMIYPSDLVFPKVWDKLNQKMAALEKYRSTGDVPEEERLRVDHEFLQTASAYESQNRTPWLQSTVKMIEEKTNAFIEAHPDQNRANAQAYYLQKRAQWFGMLPSDLKAMDSSVRLAGIALFKEVDEEYPGSTGGLLALLDAMDLIREEEGLQSPDLIPLVERVREEYQQNAVFQRIHYRFQPFVLGAYGLPDFTVTDLEGKVWDTTELDAKATLIDFWATWCGPCRREIPNLVRLYEEYKDQGFEILGISVDDPSKTTEEQLRSWAAEYEMDWPLVYDKQYWNSPAVRACGVQGIPFPILVDDKGHVIAAGAEATGGNLREALQTIFG